MALTDVRILYFGVDKTIVGYGDVLRIDVTLQERTGNSGTLKLTPYLGKDSESWWYTYPDMDVTLSAFETKAVTYLLYVPEDSDIKDILVMAYSPDFLTKFDELVHHDIITVVPEAPYTPPVDILQVTPYKRDYVYGESMGLDITLENTQAYTNYLYVVIYVGNESTGSWWKYPDTYVVLSPGEVDVLTKHLAIPADSGVTDILVMTYDLDLIDKYDEMIKHGVLSVTPPPAPTHARVELMNLCPFTFSPKLGYSIRPEGASLWKDAPIVTGAPFSNIESQTMDSGQVDVPVTVHGKVYAWLQVYDPNNKVIASAGGPDDTSVYFDVY